MSPYAVIHNFIPIDVRHNEETLKYMIELGLIEDTHHPFSDKIKFVPKDEFKHLLAAERHMPVCYSIHGPVSPANAFLFGMLHSSMNLQFVTAYILLRYLAKYVASVDKANKLLFCSNNKDEDVIRILPEEGFNTKIAGNRIAEKMKDQQDKKRKYRIEGRGISIAEVLMQFLKYAMIRTSMKFEYIPTQPMGCRPMIPHPARVEKLKENKTVEENVTIQDLDPGEVFSNY